MNNTDNLFEMEEVHNDIYLVCGENNGRFPFSRSVLITDSVNVLIDAGCGLKTLTEIDRNFPLDMVIYSHAHPDHCSGCWYFPPEIIWGPEERSNSTGNLKLMARRFLKHDLQNDWILLMRENLEFRDFKAKNFFSRGKVFKFGNITMESIHAPGHSDDHYCFYFPGEKIMLTTDVDFTPFGPWYGNEESDIDKFIASINRLKEYDIQKLIPSHREVIREDIEGHFDEFLDIFDYRDKKILEFLTSPKSIDDFVEEALIYRKYPYWESLLRYWESQMISKHLGRLISKNLVVERDGKFYQSV